MSESIITDGRISWPSDSIVPDSVKDAIRSASIWKDQDLHITPLAGGLNNENWLVISPKGIKYFIKVPGIGTGYIDRSAGDAGTQRASDLGIGATVYEFDRESGVEITEFLDGYDTCTTTSLRTQKQGLQVMDIYRKLHDSELFANRNTLFDQIDTHLHQIREQHIQLPSWALELVDEYRDVKERFEASGLSIVPCHNDPMPGNFMTRDDAMKIIDFEFCGNNEETCELGLFLAEMFYEDEDAMPLLEEYFGKVSAQQLARVQASRVIGDVKWGLWGIINSVIRDVQFDYWKYGIWKLMRAYTYSHQLDWDQVKTNI